jgi:hypothetical protein
MNCCEGECMVLSKDTMAVLLFIYASNDVNMGGELSTRALNNESIKWEEILNNLRAQGLLNDIRRNHTKNKSSSEIIYCKVTQKGKIEAENSFKLFVLKNLITKKQFSWAELKVLIIQEFHCSEIPSHVRKFGMKIIQEFICIEILTYSGSSFNIINTIFNVNQEKFTKK